MKIKLDENLPIGAIQVLVKNGHDVETVEDDGLSGASDPVVAAACRDEDRFLITLDRGFGDIRAYAAGTHPGILVLRLPDQRPELAAAAIARLLAGHNLEDYRGCVLVLHERLLRVRRPPDRSTQ